MPKLTKTLISNDVPSKIYFTPKSALHLPTAPCTFQNLAGTLLVVSVCVCVCVCACAHMCVRTTLMLVFLTAFHETDPVFPMVDASLSSSWQVSQITNSSSCINPIPYFSSVIAMSSQRNCNYTLIQCHQYQMELMIILIWQFSHGKNLSLAKAIRYGHRHWFCLLVLIRWVSSHTHCVQRAHVAW